MMEEIALEKEEEEAKANFSEKHNVRDKPLESVNRDNSSAVHNIEISPDPQKEGSDIEEIPFKTNTADPEILNNISDGKPNDSNITSEVLNSASSDTPNSELLESLIVKL